MVSPLLYVIVALIPWHFAAQVALQALYKQVGTLLPNGRARHTLRLRAVWVPTATESEEGTLATGGVDNIVRD